jgi:hypothetical protein
MMLGTLWTLLLTALLGLLNRQSTFLAMPLTRALAVAAVALALL